MMFPLRSSFLALFLFASCTATIGGGSGIQDDGGNTGDSDGGPSDSDAEVQLSCDPGWEIHPDRAGAEALDAETGSLNFVAYSSTVTGYVYVDAVFQGPGRASERCSEVLSGDSPWKWGWWPTFSAAGVWTVTFTARVNDQTQEISSCQFIVKDTGEPPDNTGDCGTGSGGGGGGGDADCTGKVCGQDDGAGDKCTACPIVGSSLANPSPAGPSAGDSPWQTLDNAGCLKKSGLCRVWCPFEKCVDPYTSCPNNLEACYVGVGQTSYEQACADCCAARVHNPSTPDGHEGKHSCWDVDYGTCRFAAEDGACDKGPPVPPWQ
jgi:hypothetical protein